MSERSAFQRGAGPWLQVLLAGREDALLSVAPDKALQKRIEELAGKSTEGELTPAGREEYAGYVRADQFIAILCREAQAMQESAVS